MYRLLFVLVVLLAGCSEYHTYRATPDVPPEEPVANLPNPLHERNWVSSRGEGSCVIASSVMALRWIGQDEEAAKWRRTYSGGQTQYSIMSIYNDNGIPYAAELQGNPAFFDWVTLTRRAAILWWKPYHCCLFVGYSVRSDGKEYAGIIDNNKPGVIEWHPRETFIRKWRSEYGGFALAPLVSPPASPLANPGYERLR